MTPLAMVGTLDALGLAPRALGPAVAARLQASLERALPACLSDAFTPLEAVDPGAYWVLREVDVELWVPASEPDPQRQGRRIADALAAAVEAVVRRGPTSGAVRFTGRADYVAAYLRARLGGSGPGWVFARLAQLDALTAGDALPAAARAVDVPLLDVVALLVRPGGGWQRLLGALTAPETARLAEALSRETDPLSVGVNPAVEPTPPALGAPVSLADSSYPDGAVARARLSRLGLLGEWAGETGTVTAAEIRAAWRTSATLPPVPPGNGDGPAPRPVPADPYGPAADGATSAGRTDPAGAAPSILASPGVAAATLLPDLEALLRGQPELTARDEAAGWVRAAILAGVFGGAVDPRDPALSVLSGGADPPEDARVAELIAGPLAEILAGLDPAIAFVHEADAERFRGTPVRVASGALLRAFAQHLHGFGRASATHLVPRVLPPGGRLTVRDELIDAVVPAAALSVLLALAGLDAFSCRPGWLTLPVLVTHEELPWDT